jgi:hypothetical protein
VEANLNCRTLIEELVAAKGNPSKVKYHSKYTKSDLWYYLGRLSTAVANVPALLGTTLNEIAPLRDPIPVRHEDQGQANKMDNLPDTDSGGPSSLPPPTSMCPTYPDVDAGRTENNGAPRPKLCKSRWSGSKCAVYGL